MRGYERPIIVAPDAELLMGRPTRWTVESHKPSRAGYKLVLRPEAGASIAIEYALARDMKLPVADNSTVLVSMTLDGRGLQFRDKENKLLALVSSDGAMADALGLAVEAQGDAARVLYTEAVESHTGCREVVEHVDAVLRDGDRLVAISPGEVFRLTLTDFNDRPRFAADDLQSDLKADYDFVLLDASRQRLPLRSDSDVGAEQPLALNCPTRAHFSWVLLWVNGPAGPTTIP